MASAVVTPVNLNPITVQSDCQQGILDGWIHVTPIQPSTSDGQSTQVQPTLDPMVMEVPKLLQPEVGTLAKLANDVSEFIRPRVRLTKEDLKQRIKDKNQKYVLENQFDIESILKATLEANTIKTKHAEIRNILLLGRSRSGKSTCLNVLKDPVHIGGTKTLFAETAEARLHSFAVNSNLLSAHKLVELAEQTDLSEEDLSKKAYEFATQEEEENSDEISPEVQYNINIMDTPGLFEVKPKQYQGQRRDNETLKNLILECMDLEITKVHAIFFVCSFVGGVNDEDIAAITEFFELFKAAQPIICLLITRSERMSSKDKKELLEEMRSHPKLAPVLNMMQNRVFFTGAISRQQYDAGLSDAVNQDAINVMDMRNILYRYILSCKKEVHLRSIDCLNRGHMQFLQQKKESIEREFERLGAEDVENKKAFNKLMEEYEVIEREMNFSDSC